MSMLSLLLLLLFRARKRGVRRVHGEGERGVVGRVGLPGGAGRDAMRVACGV